MSELGNHDTSERQQVLLKWLEEVVNEKTKRYIQERVIGQMEWYRKKSSNYKNSYQFWSTVSIILSGIIPVMSILADGSLIIKILIAALGATVTGIGAYLSLHSYKNTWEIYRSNREKLLSILYLYFNQAGIFGKELSQDDRDTMLIETCEKYFQQEVTDWKNINR